MSGAYNILSIDTALSACNVGLLTKAGDVFAKSESMMRGQSEALLPMVQELMKNAGAAFPALDAVVTTIGPGAFTGLRIGMSTARSMALALNIPVCGVTTLEVMAHQFEGEKPCCVVLETKRGDFYAQVFGQNKEELTQAQVLSVTGVEEMIKPFEDIVVVGDAVERFLEESEEPHDADKGVNMIDPQIMLTLAQRQLMSGRITPAEPLYLRDADVSERKTPLRVLAK